MIDTVSLKFLIFLTRFRKALAPRIDSWIQDGVFQIQRRAFEGQGQGTWENLEKEIPTTVEKVKLNNSPLDCIPASSPQGSLSCKCHGVTTTEISVPTSSNSSRLTSTSTSNITPMVNPAVNTDSISAPPPLGTVEPNDSGNVEAISPSTSTIPATLCRTDEVEQHNSNQTAQTVASTTSSQINTRSA